MNLKRWFAPATVMAVGAALLIGATTAMAASGPTTQFSKFVSDGRSQPAAAIDEIGGGTTEVTLDPSTLSVLQQNGVSVAPVGPATVTQNNGQTDATFPVIGGSAFVFPKSDTPYIRGTIFHSGGLTFSAGAKSLTVTNFVIDASTSILSAQVGNAYVPLFQLAGSNVTVGKNASGDVTLDGTVVQLTPQAAAALNSTFGVSIFKAGIVIGTAHVTLQAATS